MKVFTTTEITAEFFGTTTQTIRNWVTEGSLKAAPRLSSRREVLRIYVASIAERAGLPVDQVERSITAIEEVQRSERANKPGALAAA